VAPRIAEHGVPVGVDDPLANDAVRTFTSQGGVPGSSCTSQSQGDRSQCCTDNGISNTSH
jgi:hypothetical protein